jgi:hypothetical protein
LEGGSEKGGEERGWRFEGRGGKGFEERGWRFEAIHKEKGGRKGFDGGN